jgi:membrane-associated phospholipid phosphatase
VRPTSGGSAAVRVVRDSWSAARRGWRETPGPVRSRAVARLVGATVAAAAVSFILALILPTWADSAARLPGDAAVDAWVEGVISVHSALWLGAVTSSPMVVPLVVLAAVLWARDGRWDRAVQALTAFVASKAIIMAGWLTWARPRPADVGGGEIVPAGMSSFPSGHSVQALTIYGLLTVWWITATDRGWERALAVITLLVGSALVGIARIRIGAHHPTDVAGGMLLGALWLAGASWSDRACRGPAPRAG